MSITFDQLVAFAAGRVSPGDAARIKAHVEADPSAMATVQRFREIIGIARSDDSVNPPESVLSAAKAQFQERLDARNQHAEGLLEKVTRIVAELVFDGRRQPALAGLRGGGGGYQLSYESAVASVDLEVTPADGKSLRLMGQVSPRDEISINEVTLTPAAEARTITSSRPDDSGVFQLVVTPGTYDIQIRMMDTVVVLQEIEIE